MNKPKFLFVIFKMFFPANLGGSELESQHASAEVFVFIFYTMLLLTSEALVRRWWLAEYQWNLLFQTTTNHFTDI